MTAEIVSYSSILYSFCLAGFRHTWCEDNGLVDSITDLIISSIPTGLLIFAPFPIMHVISPILASLLSIRMYHKYVSGPMFEKIDLHGKVFIITGSNTGIGYETAKQLIQMNATVILACRSVDKANEAKESLLQLLHVSPTKIIVLELDLCEFDSVRNFVKQFLALGLPLHGLINNAGVMMSERQITKSGNELLLTANHLSHFLLTNLLLDALKATKGRIVNLTSSVHNLTKEYDFSDIQAERNFSLFGTYAQTKLANILFTFELQRRLEEGKTGVTANAVHPGTVMTEVTKNMPFFMRLGDQICYPIMLLLRKTRLQGACSSIYAATSPELEGIGGLYIFHCKSKKASVAAYDKEAAKRLWALSAELTNL